jgi:hypothetical protein
VKGAAAGPRDSFSIIAQLLVNRACERAALRSVPVAKRRAQPLPALSEANVSAGDNVSRRWLGVLPSHMLRRLGRTKPAIPMTVTKAAT